MLLCSVHRLLHLKIQGCSAGLCADKAEDCPDREENWLFPRKEADCSNLLYLA